jgi:hypothetical protein
METQSERTRRLTADRQRKRRRRLREEDQEDALHEYYDQLLTVKFACSTTDKAVKAFHELMVDMAEKVAELKRAGLVTKDSSKIFSYAASKVPKVLSAIAYTKTEGEEENVRKEEKDLEEIPLKLLRRGPTQDVKRIQSYIAVKDLLAHVSSIHPDLFEDGIKASLSLDGIPESHSGVMSLKVSLIISYFSISSKCSKF